MTPLAGSWGLADDLLGEETTSRVWLLIGVARRRFAVEREDVAAVVDRPLYSPWLAGGRVPAVFTWRGEIYALVDPFEVVAALDGRLPPVTVVLHRPGRRLALGVERVLGMREVEEARWRPVRGARVPWLQQQTLIDGRAVARFDVGRYLEAVTTKTVE